MREPIETKPRHGGIQKVYKFDNGYGASVIRHSGSYGGNDGLWELAVIKFQGEGKWSLDYRTSITDDVIGYLSDQEVDDLLGRVEALES